MTEAPELLPSRSLLARYRHGLKTGDWVVGTATVLAGIGGSLIVTAGAVFGPSIVESLKSAQAASKAVEVLEIPVVESLPAGVNKTPISGALKKPLPSGRQIFVTTQGPISDKIPGRLDAGNLTFSTPCSVNEAERTYRCDDVQLGLPGEGGVFKIYIGLADSTAARTIGHGLYAQAVASANNQHVVNRAPDAGYDVVGGGVTVLRDGPLASTSNNTG